MLPFHGLSKQLVSFMKRTIYFLNMQLDIKRLILESYLSHQLVAHFSIPVKNYQN